MFELLIGKWYDFILEWWIVLCQVCIVGYVKFGFGVVLDWCEVSDM